MNYLNRQPNYDKEPEIVVSGYEDFAWEGYNDILKEIKSRINKDKFIITVDTYPGVKDAEVLDNMTKRLKPDYIIKSEDVFYDGEKLTQLMQRNLTDDRVFGIMYYGSILDFIDDKKLEKARTTVNDIKRGTILIYGVAASLISRGDILIYADMARWEIQKRFRRGELGNYKADNLNDDPLVKYKRGYFIEWRVADRHKEKLFDDIDYLLDTNIYDNPKMITGDAFRAGLTKAISRPFRVVPYFDPGVWGGQWMKQVCNLDKTEDNYAWCFDCVPEENSLYLKYGKIRVEVPSLDVVLYKPIELLGEKVYARFGAEFPIRFDFLDTMDGQNLSLQVHPSTDYIQKTFGMHYTQDESYYILDAKDDACVYLGLNDSADKKDFITDLEKAQKGEIVFDTDKYVNKFPAKKHDHFMIPAGTIHCSGSNCMVLEISATPYIFTFKLWDWGRLGLDGKPRPVHINHGKNVIRWDRTTKWVYNNLIDKVKIIAEDGNYKEEVTGLHEFEFIETRRTWSDGIMEHNTQGIVNVLNLVEGEEAIVESPQNKFEPFIVHYAETFIVPAAVGEYTVRPYGRSKKRRIATIKAYVKF
ncbi:class I mannose-6-phosphate isomerase [Tepidanaerobacter syntrophicus]|uniref:class I mannose-6-phosphate isomerase n=1 Tax=Tepidanaerobacter syntrophicus TaxID=224999 RepID=UPI001BD2C0BC|nr:class I mannose-6-phosphate isomerase [Tepidanaerobacter syntrophicus]GLI20079.1 mannose-6-phosphate isomerase [Tepidanaerobacter syntrophicus]